MSNIDFNQLVTAEQKQEQAVEKAATDKRREIERDFAGAVAQMTAGYPEDEVKSWDQQKEEARAFAADPDALTPLLDSMIATSGETKEDLTTLILDNADAFALFYGKALGVKRARIKALNAIDLTAADAKAQIAEI